MAARPNRPLVLGAVLLILAPWASAVDEIIPTRRKDTRRDGPPNPLREVSDEMGTAGRRLKDGKTSNTTQKLQKEILEKLKTLVDKAQQQQKQSQNQSQNQAKKRQQQKMQPKPDPQQQQKKQEQQKKQTAQQKQEQKKKTERPGIGQGRGKAGAADLHTDAEEWGNLPPAIRDQLLQSPGEGFPLKYRELLRRYYRELAKPRE